MHTSNTVAKLINDHMHMHDQGSVMMQGAELLRNRRRVTIVQRRYNGRPSVFVQYPRSDCTSSCSVCGVPLLQVR